MNDTPNTRHLPTTPAACWMPVVDPLTWYALSEVVNHRFRVSILTGPGRWAEFTLDPEDTTHRRAVAIAVHRLTGRTVTDITTCRPVGDGCASYRITVAPTTDTPARATPREIGVPATATLLPLVAVDHDKRGRS